jgi:hypothetical protein
MNKPFLSTRSQTINFWTLTLFRSYHLINPCHVGNFWRPSKIKAINTFISIYQYPFEEISGILKQYPILIMVYKFIDSNHKDKNPFSVTLWIFWKIQGFLLQTYRRLSSGDQPHSNCNAGKPPYHRLRGISGIPLLSATEVWS